ncbi:MAG TPA: hypothetical protein VH640_14220 [Bryobacteraceae bacterium]|jgi:hypothetical protein
MAKLAQSASNYANDRKAEAAASELGRKLRSISERIASSGEKLLTRRELERELAQRRGGIR